MPATRPTTKDLVSQALDRLTPEQQREVLDFAAFLDAKRKENLPATREPVVDWKVALRQARGMWKDRENLPEFFEDLRRSWDRHV